MVLGVGRAQVMQGGGAQAVGQAAVQPADHWGLGQPSGRHSCAAVHNRRAPVWYCRDAAVHKERYVALLWNIPCAFTAGPDADRQEKQPKMEAKAQARCPRSHLQLRGLRGGALLLLLPLLLNVRLLGVTLRVGGRGIG